MTKPFDPQDKFFQKAKQQKKRARSYFKLEELDKRYRFMRHGDVVLDIGAAPGSFSQYAIERIGRKGRVIGIDLQAIDPLGTQFESLQGDIYETATKDTVETMLQGPVDGIISDLAPKTSGIKDLDHAESIELSFEVLRWMDRFAKKGAYCVIKIFHGEDFDFFLRQAKRRFEKVKPFKPAASRDRSKETYLICMNFLKGKPGGKR